MKPCRSLYGLLIVAQLVGCAGPALRSQSPEDLSESVESTTRLVGEVTRPYGNNYIKVEAPGLVTGLDATGEDPPPSPQRSMMMHEMQAHGVQDPNQVLASPNTALVLVRGFLPPGVKKGDKFDLDMIVPPRSATTSLRGGWLMEARMTEMAVLDNQLHEGHLLALGQGPVLIDPSATKENNKTLLVQGHVLGGGTALKTRPLGLVVNGEDKSIRMSMQVGEAVNRRFHVFEHGNKRGVANPKTDDFIELQVHPRYQDNVGRYIRVVRALPLQETIEEQYARIQLLEQQLLDPVTAATAALRLEAIGKDSLKTLLRGVESKDPEVRFYAAEALAYLDDSKAAEPLAEAARDEPAFRAFALAALSAMDDISAYEQLRTLLDMPSAETRYGAFRALWAMNPRDPLVKGEKLGGFNYHVLSTSGPAMIHVTRSFRPEIVVFGHEQHFETPLVLEAGPRILINADEGELVTISRFAVGEPDQKRVVSTKVDDVIRAIVELGGNYPDVVQALQQAKTSRALSGRFEVDAIPDSSRAYRRIDSEENADEGETEERYEVANPIPELFSTRKSKR